jgi:DNA-binding MarR family transcriptional regulator
MHSPNSSVDIVANQDAPAAPEDLLKRVHALVVEVLEPVCMHRGCTFDQYLFLNSIRDGRASQPSDLAHLYRRNPGTVTRLVDQLETPGFVRRLSVAGDRRKVQLELTRVGRSAIEKLRPEVASKLELAFADLSEIEIETLDQLLLKTYEGLRSLLATKIRKAKEA